MKSETTDQSLCRSPFLPFDMLLLVICSIPFLIPIFCLFLRDHAQTAPFLFYSLLQWQLQPTLHKNFKNKL